MISIKKGKSNYQPYGQECLYISFPYNPETVQKIKTLPERRYNAQNKTWITPLYSIEEILKLFDLTELEIDDNIDLECKKENITSQYNITFFNSTLSKIQNPEIMEFTKQGLLKLPEYFWEIQASSTGKYHPSYALGTGGLIRHTKAALLIAEELFNNPLLYQFTDVEKDIIRSAIHLHDGVKHGINGSSYTVSTHPLDVVNLLKNSEVNNLISSEISNLIYGCIKSHMGPWNTDYSTKEEVLPVPTTKLQKFVHLCDYLASRKILEVVLND